MTIETIKHRYLILKREIQTKYWPYTVQYIENNSPLKLFIRALFIGLLLSIPWQCSRLVFNSFFSKPSENSIEINSTLTLPKFDDGSVTNMPNPRARRPLPVQIETEPVATDESSQVQETESSSPITQADQDAKILIQTAPEYPAASLRKHESGTVLIQVNLDSEGAIKDVFVKQSSNHKALDRAAQKAVSKWKFSPKISNGETVQSELLIPIEYKPE